MKKVADATKAAAPIPPVVVAVHVRLALVVPAVEGRVGCVRQFTHTTTP